MYLDNFNNKDDVLWNFSEDPKNHDNTNILFAHYELPDYEGYAFVLFERDGKLYEVNGSHCSCYGLEGQWDPEETSIEELTHRIDKGNFGSNYAGQFANELQEVLKQWGG